MSMRGSVQGSNAMEFVSNFCNSLYFTPRYGSDPDFDYNGGNPIVSQSEDNPWYADVTINVNVIAVEPEKFSSTVQDFPFKVSFYNEGSAPDPDSADALFCWEKSHDLFTIERDGNVGYSCADLYTFESHIEHLVIEKNRKLNGKRAN